MDLIDSLTTAYSLTTIFCDDIDSDDLAEKYITASLVSSTLGINTNVDLPDRITIEMASNYIDSLSTEELEEFDKLLAQKEEFFMGEQQSVTSKSYRNTEKKEKVYLKNDSINI